MSKSVGLEIHARGIRAVEVTGKGKKFKILRYMEKAISPRGGQPDPEELQEALAEVFKGAKFSRNTVITSLPAEETVVREIPVPFKSDDQIRKVIKYEAEHHLHDRDADDVVVQYTHIGESGDGANLLVFAAGKDGIGRRIEALRGAGVEPLAMELDAAAYYNAVRVTGAFDAVPAAVLLNIGHKSTELIFVQEGEVRAVRSVRMGVDSIVHGLARDMDIEFAEADSKFADLSFDDAGDLMVLPDDEKRETEKSHAELERDLFTAKRDDFIVRLRREYVRSSAATRGARPEKIIATGPGLRVTGLIDLLGKRLGMSIEVFRPSEAFSVKLGDTPPEVFDAGAAVAIGLALKGQGDDAIGIDFRQEELKVANKFELLKTTLAVTVTLVFLSLMASSFYFVYKRQSLLSNRYDDLVLRAYQSFSKVTQKYNELGGDIVQEREKVDPGQIEMDGPRPEAIKRFVRRLSRMQSKLARYVGDEKGLPPINSALATWNEIFGAIQKLHKDLEYIDFESIKITQTTVSVTIIVPSVAAVETLQEPLSNLPSMKEMVFNKQYSITPYEGRQRTTLEWNKPRERGRARRG